MVYNLLYKKKIILVLSILSIIFFLITYYACNKIIILNSQTTVFCQVQEKITKNTKVYGYYDIFTAVNETNDFQITKINCDEKRNICNVELEYEGKIIDFYEEVNRLYDNDNILSINNISIDNIDENKCSIKLSTNFIKNN